MLESIAPTRFEEKYIQRIERNLALLERQAGRDVLRSPYVVGFHGTSLHSVNLAVKNGAYLTGPDGNFYYMPIRSRFTDHPLVDTFNDKLEAFDAAAKYARYDQMAHFLGIKLRIGVEEDNAILKELVFTLIENRPNPQIDALIRQLVKRGFSKDYLAATFSTARVLKGVVLGLNGYIKNMTPYTSEDSSRSDGDIWHGDLKITQPLPLKDVHGITPMGEVEKSALLKIVSYQPRKFELIPAIGI